MKLKEQSVSVSAPRDLVFEVVAAAGKKIDATGTRSIVEFETAWRGRTIKTVEEVELFRPDRISYRWIEGPLEGVEEDITFGETGAGLTLMSYRGTFRPQPGALGWVRSFFFVRPTFNKLVLDHLREGGRIAEERARRSRVYPSAT